jgi:hypothetical protein
MENKINLEARRRFLVELRDWAEAELAKTKAEAKPEVIKLPRRIP